MCSNFYRMTVKKDELLHSDEAINPPIHLVWEDEILHWDGEATKRTAYIYLQDSGRSSEETGNFRLHFDEVNDELVFQRFGWYNQSSSHNVRVNEFRVCGIGHGC